MTKESEVELEEALELKRATEEFKENLNKILEE